VSSSIGGSYPEYDAVVIGAGHNGLTCACYLAKAGLRVLVIEEYHVIGGMTITEEIVHQGFKSDIHAFGYQIANFSPVPTELSLSSYGFRLIMPEISFSHIYPNGKCVAMFQSLDKTINEISKYSVKDSNTWANIFKQYLKEKESIVNSINNPPYTSKYADKRNSTETSYFQKFRSDIQSMRSWCNELFETEEIKAMFGTFSTFVGLSPDDAGGGRLCYLFSCAIQDKGNNVVEGGFGNLPLALEKYLRSNGGDILTKSKVTKILINGNRATGVQLDNGQTIAVRKVIASSIAPSSLILDLIGEQHVSSDLVRDIKHIEWGDAIYGIYMALNSAPSYKADKKVTKSAQLHLSPPGLEYFTKMFYNCRSGILSPDVLPIMSNDSMVDPSRAPIGKHLIKFLIPNVPYDIKKSERKFSEKLDWTSIKELYSNEIIDMVSENYITNLKDILLKKISLTPLDYEKRPTTSVKGTLSCGSMIPYQSNSMRPTPQLSNYKIPTLENVYLCGSGSHPGPGVSMAPGRNASKVIVTDLGLDPRNIFNR